MDKLFQKLTHHLITPKNSEMSFILKSKLKYFCLTEKKKLKITNLFRVIK